MPVQLPLVASIPNYRVGITLDGTSFLFDVRWNAREDAWFFDVLTEDETELRTGIKIVLGAALGKRTANPDYPPGLLLASDLSGEQREATFDDLGIRVAVYYYSPEEL